MLDQVAKGIYYGIVAFLFPTRALAKKLVKLHWLICLFSLPLLNWWIMLSIMTSWLMMHNKLTWSGSWLTILHNWKSASQVVTSTNQQVQVDLPCLIRQQLEVDFLHGLQQFMEWSPSQQFNLPFQLNKWTKASLCTP